MVVGGAECTQRGRCGVLSHGGTLLGGGDSTLRRKCRELPAGVKWPAVSHRGVLLGTRRCLDNRGHRTGHHPTSQGGHDADGQIF